MLCAVPNGADGSTSMFQDVDRSGLAQPDPEFQTGHPRQGHQAKEPFQSRRIGDPGPFQIEAARLEAAEGALDRPAASIELPGLSDAEVRRQDHEVSRGRPRGHDPQAFPEDDDPLTDLPEDPGRDGAEPVFSAQVVDQVAVPQTDDSPNPLVTKKAEPLRPDELPIGDEALPAFRWQQAEQAEDDPHAGSGGTVAGVIEGQPDEGDGVALYDRAQDKEIDG